MDEISLDESLESCKDHCTDGMSLNQLLYYAYSVACIKIIEQSIQLHADWAMIMNSKCTADRHDNNSCKIIQGHIVISGA